MQTILVRTVCDAAGPASLFLASALAFAVGWWWLAVPQIALGLVVSVWTIREALTEERS